MYNIIRNMGSAGVTEAQSVELRYIKTLYLGKHYRQCTQTCRALLDATQEPPSHIRLFVNFYLGLAHDELARLMLELSPARIPSFNQAEQFYREALCALPAVQEQLRLATATPRLEHDPFFAAAQARSPEQIAHDSYYQFASQPSSPQPSLRKQKVPVQLSQPLSRDTSGSDLTDVESHSSFDQILTPGKMVTHGHSRMRTLDEPPHRPIRLPPTSVSHGLLQRELSRISLLDDSPPRRPSGLPRTTSTVADIRQVQLAEDTDDRQYLESPPRQVSRPPSLQQGLMKPIRMGSPAKAYHLPQRAPQLSGNILSRSSTLPLPKLATKDLNRKPPSALPNGKTTTAASWAGTSPVSPVSPLDSEGDASEVTTTSPVSPATPRRSSFDEPLPIVAEESDEDIGKQPFVSENIKAMEMRLQSHIAMVIKMKGQTLAIQATRAAERPSSLASPMPLSRPGSSSSSNHDSVMSADSRRLVLEKKSLAMLDQDIDTPEQRRKRVESGRARRWERPRFDATRYINLAEQALAEL